MSTFLELCQDTERESGTFPTLLTTTASQTGRHLRAVNWVADAWQDIQKMRSDWLWMVDEWTGQTTASTQRYSAASFSIDSRFSKWVLKDRDGYDALSAYKTSDGQSGEVSVEYVPWHEFRRRCLRGSGASQTGAPQLVSVDDAQQLVFYPIPDAAYTLNGLYAKSPQILSDDDDVPEMPAEFHPAIKWRALLYLGAFDEAGAQMGFWDQQLRRTIGELTAHQLPPVRRAGPLA